MTYTTTERTRLTNARYKKRYDLLRHRGIPTSPMPSGPVLEHLRALHELGWSAEAISHLADGVVTHAAITRLLRGEYPTVQRKTAGAILPIPLSLNPPSRVPDSCMIPALGAVRRVRALMRLGWNHDVMRERYGFDTTALARSRVTQMATWKWRRVDAMYEELCMTLGPSQKTATYARNYRWHPPLSWVDIDDPAERPQYDPHENVRDGGVVDRAVVSRLLAGERTPSTKAEKQEAMRRWLALGRSEASLCKAQGWKEGRYTQRKETAA